MTSGRRERHGFAHHLPGVDLATEEQFLRWWERDVGEFTGTGLPEYDREDQLLDQLDRLPSEEQIERLLELLRSPEIKALAKGVIIDSSTACKKVDILEVARGINEWIATSEEILESRRRMRHILHARRRSDTITT